ncbi:MAG TPA: transcriptional regulator [Cyanobacteria bacterium UBA11369]|nr:transcriptional regulator [Cyanobacteria bacterium UBA11371]HBE17632.1 transcriptional regulator [Cyanobacteria bacterium UBA11367]HBE35633.1 transcriptional regulator [Cyanobacteria bacterium UBA11368]HBE48981.1 transcriptional regulator [Cyanobacteria bacterium UBA11369]
MTAGSVPSTLQERQNRLTQLIEHLLQEGWTQSDLAQALDVDFSTVHRWLRGKTIPDPDSKNFRRLAKVSGGNSRKLQLYLDGEISLSIYRNGLDKKAIFEVKTREKSNSEQLKKEILAKICTLDPIDIAEIISSSVVLLANQKSFEAD